MMVEWSTMPMIDQGQFLGFDCSYTAAKHDMQRNSKTKRAEKKEGTASKLENG